MNYSEIPEGVFKLLTEIACSGKTFVPDNFGDRIELARAFDVAWFSKPPLINPAGDLLTADGRAALSWWELRRQLSPASGPVEQEWSAVRTKAEWCEELDISPTTLRTYIAKEPDSFDQPTTKKMRVRLDWLRRYRPEK